MSEPCVVKATDDELHAALGAAWLLILRERHPDIVWVLEERERVGEPASESP